MKIYIISTGGHYAPCFILAKQLKKSPAIASELWLQGVNSYIDSAKAEGGYLNIFINKAEYANAVIEF